MKKGIEKSNSCDGKTRYRIISDANEAAEQLNRKSSDSQRLSSYKCFFCSGYHLGHENKRSGKLIRNKREKKKLDPKDYSSKRAALNEGYCIIKQAG